MRRACVTVAACLLLAGCGAPGGTDGDLVNGWAVLPAASYSPPAPGQCLTGTAVSAFEPLTDRPQVVGCTAKHLVEVVGATDLPGGADLQGGVDSHGGAEPPAWDSDVTRAGYAACDKAVSDWVGGDWRGGRLFPVYANPAPEVWRAGGRRALCGVAEAADDLFAPASRTGSLKGALAQVTLTCVELTGTAPTGKGFYSSVSAVTPVGCAEPHDTEFVGAWVAPPGPYPPAEQLKQLVTAGCYPLAAAYLGVTEAQFYQRGDLFTFWTGLSASQWQLGDRTAHCYVNASSRTPLHGSVRGLGTKPLPVQ